MPPPPAGGDLGLGGWDGRGRGGVCVGGNGEGIWIWRRFGRIERSGGEWGKGKGSVAFPVGEISGVPEVKGIIGAIQSGSFVPPTSERRPGDEGFREGKAFLFEWRTGQAWGSADRGTRAFSSRMACTRGCGARRRWRLAGNHERRF